MKTIKEVSGKLLAQVIDRHTRAWQKNPSDIQDKILEKLITKGRNTGFGRDHDFDKIRNYSDFKERVPVRDYESFSTYINSIKEGKKDILWPGKPVYLCKTSGTTSGVKYIPLTKDSLPNHINSARNALLNYIKISGNTSFINGKMIFIQGSPVLDSTGGIPTGRLSGIVAHHVPKYLQKNRLPSHKTNCIEDWETKVDAIVEETIRENMTVIGGIPSWIQMYFEKLRERSGGKTIKEIFPNLQLMVLGGVNFDPYQRRFRQLTGEHVDHIEVFPASEGFFAYQDDLKERGLLLLLNEGIFYEFVKADEVFDTQPGRITIKDVELGINYAIIINSNAGLWGYLIGDTIKFTSLEPHRIIVTGRIKHFISAFGEHVIAEEVESAVYIVSKTENSSINEFTVAPRVAAENDELPYHEWFIEFREEPGNLEQFSKKLDLQIREQNIYYNDLIEGKVLQPLKITRIKADGFSNYMKSKGKLGGQNKIPRLANDRAIADELEAYKIL